MLHGKWWERFHKLWGFSKEGKYDKPEWCKLQTELELLDRELNELFTLVKNQGPFALIDPKVQQLKERHFTIHVPHK